jgi:hypothetical protein
MNANENDKTSLSALIVGYDFEMDLYRRKRYTSLILALFGFITGWIIVIIAYIFFLKRIKTKKKLNKTKIDLNKKLDSIADKITIEEYLNFKSRIIFAGRLNKT